MLDLQQAVSTQIRSRRLKLELDQQTLADMVNITRTSISNIENGRQALSLSMFCKLADALGQKPSKLLEEILSYEVKPSILKNEVKDPKIRALIKETIKPLNN